jgi:hypothetical protein
VLVEDESILIYYSVLAKKRRWIVKEKRPVVTIKGSHYKTIIYGVLSLDGKNNYSDNTIDLTAVSLLLHTLRRLERSLINSSCLRIEQHNTGQR